MSSSEPGIITEVHEDDFSRIGGERPPHLLIEQALVAMGGGGVRGTQFKRDSLRAAGWKYDKMKSYASKSTEARDAFNRLRVALSKAGDARELLAALSEDSL